MRRRQSSICLIGLTLAALMALTRYGHFGSAVSLPDASLAVFFLAGFYLPAWVFPALLWLSIAAVVHMSLALAASLPKRADA